MRRRDSQHDSESLQTDVMRFMAIIAFCLIAVLALVKSVEPAPIDTQPSIAATKPVVDETTPDAQPRSKPAEAPGPSQAVDPEPTLDAEPVPEPAPEPAPEPVVAEPPVIPKTERPAPKPAPKAREFVMRKPLPVARRPAAIPPEPDTPRTSAQAFDTTTPAEEPSAEAAQTDEGLSLRFVSHSDFLRLISRGDVALFAYNGSDVLSLGQDYRFRTSHAPGRVYEIAPETIPRLVSNAFTSTERSLNDYTWGIRLPKRIETQIESFVNTVTSGVLLIDRYGDVRHVATS